MGNKILLIDDSVTVQKIITLTFSDEGVDVVTVDSGEKAITLLQYLRPALVMADVSIPGKNGYDICSHIKNSPELKNIPVVLLVPGIETFDADRARRVGADHHLTKPFQSIRSLITTVKSLIDPRSSGYLREDPSASEVPGDNGTGRLALPGETSSPEPTNWPLSPAPVDFFPPPLGAASLSGNAGADHARSIDQIVERVISGVANRLAGEIAAMRSEIVEAVTAEIAARLDQQRTTPVEKKPVAPLNPTVTQPVVPVAAPNPTPPRRAGNYDDPDQLLELDEF